MGMIVALGAVIAAIWLVALYGTYKEAQTEKYDVRVNPGAVTYGTHSTAPIPMVSSPTHRSSAPMISGSAIRSYAYQGHATMPSTTGSGFKLQTTSSATVHTIGSGGGAGSIGSASGSSSLSRGITYSESSVSMPTFALVTPTYASETSKTSNRYSIGPRKMPSDPGDEGDTEWDEGKWWYWDVDNDTWITDTDLNGTYAGLTRNTGSGIEVWNGSKWVTMAEWLNPGVPVGATPWLLMLFLAMGYGIVKIIRKKQNAI